MPKLRDKVTVEPAANLVAAKAIDFTNIDTNVIINIGGLGLFRYNSASSATADDINIIAPTTGGGRLLRISPDFLTVDDADNITLKAGDATGTYYKPALLLHTLPATVQTSTTSEEEMFKFDLPANSMATDGDTYEFEGYFTSPSSISPTARNIKYYWQGVNFLTKTYVGLGALNAVLTVKVVRTSNTTFRYWAIFSNDTVANEVTTGTATITGFDSTATINLTGQTLSLSYPLSIYQGDATILNQ
jgi:hypothetical protein